MGSSFMYTGIYSNIIMLQLVKLVKTSVSYICKITFSFLVYMTVKFKRSLFCTALVCYGILVVGFKKYWPIVYSLGIFVHFISVNTHIRICTLALNRTGFLS